MPPRPAQLQIGATDEPCSLARAHGGARLDLSVLFEQGAIKAQPASCYQRPEHDRRAEGRPREHHVAQCLAPRKREPSRELGVAEIEVARKARSREACIEQKPRAGEARTAGRRLLVFKLASAGSDHAHATEIGATTEDRSREVAAVPKPRPGERRAVGELRVSEVRTTVKPRAIELRLAEEAHVVEADVIPEMHVAEIRVADDRTRASGGNFGAGDAVGDVLRGQLANPRCEVLIGVGVSVQVGLSHTPRQRRRLRRTRLRARASGLPWAAAGNRRVQHNPPAKSSNSACGAHSGVTFAGAAAARPVASDGQLR